MEKLRYFIREGILNIWKNQMMSIASICVLAICMLLLGSSLLVSYNVKSLINQVEDANQIMAFVKPGVDQAGQQRIGEQISLLPNVEKVTFISKAQVLEQQKKQLGKDAGLLSGLENDNPYPDTYQVQIEKMEQYQATADAIKKIEGVESINANSGVAQKLSNISRVIGFVGIWLFVILAVVTLFLISNTIKLAVFVRKREINIMKFVGATDWFIRWPFIIEGLLIGLLGGAVAIAAQSYVYTGLIARLFSALNVGALPVKTMMPWMAAAFLGTGVFLGVAGSMLSMRKYLKV